MERLCEDRKTKLVCCFHYDGEPLIMLFSSLDENQRLLLSLLNESHCFLFSFRMETIVMLFYANVCCFHG
jgi:hypothetical protein